MFFFFLFHRIGHRKGIVEVFKGGGMSQSGDHTSGGGGESTVNCNETTQHGESGGERLGGREIKRT